MALDELAVIFFFFQYLSSLPPIIVLVIDYLRMGTSCQTKMANKCTQNCDEYKYLRLEFLKCDLQTNKLFCFFRRQNRSSSCQYLIKPNKIYIRLKHSCFVLDSDIFTLLIWWCLLSLRFKNAHEISSILGGIKTDPKNSRKLN